MQPTVLNYVLTRWANTLVAPDSVDDLARFVSNVNDSTLPFFSLIRLLERQRFGVTEIPPPSVYLPRELAAYESLDSALRCLRRRNGSTTANLVRSRDFFNGQGVLDVLWEVFIVYGFTPLRQTLSLAEDWFSNLVETYAAAAVTNDLDFRSGVRLCVVMNVYFPERVKSEMINMFPSTAAESESNIELALSALERQLNLDTLLTPSLWVNWDLASYFIPLCLITIKDALSSCVPRAPRQRWNTSALSPARPTPSAPPNATLLLSPPMNFIGIGTPVGKSEPVSRRIEPSTPLSPIISTRPPFTPYSPANPPSCPPSAVAATSSVTTARRISSPSPSPSLQTQTPTPFLSPPRSRDPIQPTLLVPNRKLESSIGPITTENVPHPAETAKPSTRMEARNFFKKNKASAVPIKSNPIMLLDDSLAEAVAAAVAAEKIDGERPVSGSTSLRLQHTLSNRLALAEATTWS